MIWCPLTIIKYFKSALKNTSRYDFVKQIICKVKYGILRLLNSTSSRCDSFTDIKQDMYTKLRFQID